MKRFRAYKRCYRDSGRYDDRNIKVRGKYWFEAESREQAIDIIKSEYGNDPYAVRHGWGMYNVKELA